MGTLGKMMKKSHMNKGPKKIVGDQDKALSLHPASVSSRVQSKWRALLGVREQEFTVRRNGVMKG